LPMRAAICCTKACHSARVGAGTCRNTDGAPSTETYSLIDAFGIGLQFGHDAAVAGGIVVTSRLEKGRR
jgi:hypothetical protein